MLVDGRKILLEMENGNMKYLILGLILTGCTTSSGIIPPKEAAEACEAETLVAYISKYKGKDNKQEVQFVCRGD